MSSPSVSTTAKRAIVISWVITCALGCAYVLWHWARRDGWIDGVLRSAALVCFLAVAHHWGYKSYIRQLKPVPDPPLTPPPSDKPVKHPLDIMAIIVQQGLGCLVGSCILDGGNVFKLACATIAVHWVAIVLILGRGERSLTPLDRVFIQFGYFPLLYAVALTAHLVWAAKGLI